MWIKMTTKIKNVKQALTIRKEQILNELKYYERRIEDAQELNKKNSNFIHDDSSDSDIESAINDCISITELLLQERELQKYLKATKELTDLHVLESQVNIVVDAPHFERECQIAEEGLWREVTAECRLDLVSFSLSFYVHSPERPFAPKSYRGLQVALVKDIHQKELSCSVLPYVIAPSDAIEVIRSYALAHRSRRKTLAALAEKFGDCLFMEPMSQGGYVLECTQLFQLSWTLHNKWSPVAPFHHKMSLDILQHLDESYIIKITNAHKRLSDPCLETDERTFYLTTIIGICLEAYKNIVPEKTIESDLESQNSKILQTSDQESGNSNREIMGPPKSFPKKAKPKTKENIRKRGSDVDAGSSSKRTKTDSISNVNSNYDSILKSNNSNKGKLFKNSERHINVMKNSNELKENMSHKIMEKVKSKSKKTIDMESNSRSTKPTDQILPPNETKSNKMQKKLSDNAPDYIKNVKDSAKSSAQNKNSQHKQLNAQEINFNDNVERSNYANDTITNVVTERNSKKIGRKVNKKLKSLAAKTKTKYRDEEDSKTENYETNMEILDGPSTDKENTKNKVELRREEIRKMRTVRDNDTDNYIDPDSGGNIFSKKENSKNNHKTVIKKKNNEIVRMTAKSVTSKKVLNIDLQNRNKLTLSERFSSKIGTKDITNSNTPLYNRSKSRNNVDKEPQMVNIDEPFKKATKKGPKITLNIRDDMRIHTSKKDLNNCNVQNDFDNNKGKDDSSNNIPCDNYIDCENDKPTNVIEKNKGKNNFINRKALGTDGLKNIEKNTKSHENFQKNNINNLKKFVNNQILRRSLSRNKVGNKDNEIKQKSKIPQKGISKKMNTPLRISPRKLQSISRGVQRKTHIPRLLTKAVMKPTG